VQVLNLKEKARFAASFIARRLRLPSARPYSPSFSGSVGNFLIHAGEGWGKGAG
jgi:hypothetical protein